MIQGEINIDGTNVPLGMIRKQKLGNPSSDDHIVVAVFP